MKIQRLLLPVLPLLAIAGCATNPDVDGTGDPRVAIQADEDTPLSASDMARFEAAIAATSADHSPTPILTAGRKRYVVVHVEFRNAGYCKTFRVANTHVLGRFEKFADLMIEAKKSVLLAVARARGVYNIQLPGISITPPPPKLVSIGSRATPEPVLRGGLKKLTGKGVVVAVIDSGVDFRHPDFIVKDAQGRPTSRLLGLWDTTSNAWSRGVGGKAPVTYPNGVSFGTVYTRDQLTAELRAKTKKIPWLDTNGHGTSCAGVAAGNGRGHASRRYTGVAPEADIIAVRIGGSTGSLPNMFLLGPICDWINAVSKKKPYVVSCSFGGQVGGRDGLSVFEKQIDARFAQNVKGRAICISAGNDAQKGVHQWASFNTTRPTTITWKVPKVFGRVAIYVDQIGADLRYEFTSKQKAHQVRRCFNRYTLRRYWEFDCKAGSYSMKVWAKVPPKKKKVATKAKPTKKTGLKINFAPPKKLTAHVYISRGKLFGLGVTATRQIGMPGTARQAITVGSYDFNDQMQIRGRVKTLSPVEIDPKPMIVGSLSKYSNPGPRRHDGLLKPELTAPGQFHIAAVPLNRIPADRVHEREVTQRYRAFNGTSASTPYCAGVVALMLQKNPSLTVAQIRALLMKFCTSDEHTGKTPNPKWGHGKLSLPAIRMLLDSIREKSSVPVK